MHGEIVRGEHNSWLVFRRGYIEDTVLLVRSTIDKDLWTDNIVPPAPVDRDIYEMEAEEKKDIAQTPGSLSEALDALEADHDFLLKGGVFSKDLIETYIAYKRVNDCDAIALRPHPYEFMLYYDI